MKYPTVSALCEGVAGAIRAKEGSTEKINPQDFPQRIENLKVGGGTSESNIEYLDVSGLGDTNQSLRNALVAVADIVKSKNEDGTFVGACLLGIQLLTGITNNATTCVAVAVDLSRHIKGKSIEAGGALDMSIAEILIMMTSITQELLDSIPRITKEQFYTLE